MIVLRTIFSVIDPTEDRTIHLANVLSVDSNRDTGLRNVNVETLSDGTTIYNHYFSFEGTTDDSFET